MISLSEMAEQCEQAGEPGWGLDDEIGRAIAGPDGNYCSRRYSSSVDDALLLVPREWTAWELRSRGAKTRFVADVSRERGDCGEDIETGHGSTPALALCAAALKARAASVDTDPKGRDTK